MRVVKALSMGSVWPIRAQSALGSRHLSLHMLKGEQAHEIGQASLRSSRGCSIQNATVATCCEREGGHQSKLEPTAINEYLRIIPDEPSVIPSLPRRMVCLYRDPPPQRFFSLSFRFPSKPK